MALVDICRDKRPPWIGAAARARVNGMNPNPIWHVVGRKKADIRVLVRALKELDGNTTLDALDELISENQAWVGRLSTLQTSPTQANPFEKMMLIGSPIATWPTIRSEAGRERAERSDLLGKLSEIRAQSIAQNRSPLTILEQQLRQAKHERAAFPHARTRRRPPQESTQPVPPPPCTQPYIYHYDLTKPQIQQYEADILGTDTDGRVMPGPAQGVPVTLAPALSLPPNVRGALKYVGVFKSWATAFGRTHNDPRAAPAVVPNPNQPALDQAIDLAMRIGVPSSPFVPGLTPIYVLDGANIFNRSQARWDANNRCNTQFVQAGSRPGPVIIVMQHHHFVEDILSTKSGVRTDENLKQLDFFLCQLHAWQFPIVILEMQPEKCQDTAWLNDDKGGEFPCLYNDRSKEWAKRPDGTTLQENEPGGNVLWQKKRSGCRVWEEEEDKVHAEKKLWHDFCEFDDAIVDQLVDRAKKVRGVQMTFRVSNDGNITDLQKRTNIWNEMVRLGDRLRVRLYTL